MHHQIDVLAYTNRLRSLPPAPKVGFAIALWGLGYVAPAPIQGAIAVWLAVWIVGYARIPAGVYVRLLMAPLGFLCLSLPALLLSVTWQNLSADLDALWLMQWGSCTLFVSPQSLMQAQAILMRAIALLSCLYFLLLTVPFSDLVRVLQRWGCPILLIELMILMYRFIFLLMATATELLTAQQARLGYRTWRSGMRSLSVLVGQLLGRTLASYQQIRLGLMARGFTGELRLYHTRHYRLHWRYLSEAIAGYCCLLLLTGWHYVDNF